MSKDKHECCGGNEHKENHQCCGGNNQDCGCGEETHENHDGCGCGEHEEEFMTLLLENDEEVKCSVLDIFEVENNEYIALLPIGEEEVLLYKYVEEDEENFRLENIETDEEFALVEETFFSFFEDGVFGDEEEYEYDDYDEEEE